MLMLCKTHMTHWKTNISPPLCHHTHNHCCHYGNQSRGCLMRGRQLCPLTVPRLAARPSESNPRGSGPEVVKREWGHVTSETGVSEVGGFRALQPNVEQIKSRVTKPHGARIGHMITTVMLLLIARVSSSSCENIPHTSRYALQQRPHPSCPNCSSRLADSLMQLGQIGKRPSMSPIPCSIRFMSSLPFWFRNATVSRAICGGALSCTNTVLPEDPSLPW